MELEFPPAANEANVRRWSGEFPNAILRSISGTYNCMGMVFASRRTWVDISELRMILEEDGYQKLPNSSFAFLGDVVVYQYGQSGYHHVGIIAELRRLPGGDAPLMKILSKWGDAGEYIHSLNEVPATYGVPYEYWTERRDAR